MQLDLHGLPWIMEAHQLLDKVIGVVENVHYFAPVAT